LVFIAGGRLAYTDANTQYQKGRCRDLSPDDRVKVRGTVRPGEAVRATRIEFKDDDDDDD
jgi:hypothetical protein